VLYKGLHSVQALSLPAYEGHQEVQRRRSQLQLLHCKYISALQFIRYKRFTSLPLMKLTGHDKAVSMPNLANAAALQAQADASAYVRHWIGSLTTVQSFVKKIAIHLHHCYRAHHPQDISMNAWLQNQNQASSHYKGVIARLASSHCHAHLLHPGLQPVPAAWMLVGIRICNPLAACQMC